MTNHKASGFNPFPFLGILLLLAVVYNFSGCTDARRNTSITNVPNKKAMEAAATRQKPNNGRPEDTFIYRQIVSLSFAHRLMAESMMFFVREVPDCRELPVAQRSQDRSVVFDVTALLELSKLMASHIEKDKGQYRFEAGVPNLKSKFVFEKDAQGKIRGLEFQRLNGGIQQTVAKFWSLSETITRIELNHRALLSSYQVSLTGAMTCEIQTDANFIVNAFRCQNLGHAYRAGQGIESMILQSMEFNKNGDPVLAGSGSQYRDSRPLCANDKPISFAAPKNSQVVTLFLNRHQDESRREVDTSARPAVVEQPAPPSRPVPAARPQRAEAEGSTQPVSGQLDGAPLPESAEANSALNGMGQTSAAGQLLKSPGVLEALKNQAIHDKTDSEPVSGAPVFNDPNDLNQVDPR